VNDCNDFDKDIAFALDFSSLVSLAEMSKERAQDLLNSCYALVSASLHTLPIVKDCTHMRILIPTQKAISTASSIAINIKYLLRAHDSRKAVLISSDTNHHCRIANHQATVSLTQPTLHPLKSLPAQDAACLGHVQSNS
jgi:hypothetical protein